MLPKQHRLKQDKDFNRAFRRGRRGGVGVVGITFVRTPLKVSRVAVVVGSKISKKAVVRNRIRRRIREILRDLLKHGKVPAGYDIVINARSGAVQQTYAALRRDVFEAFRRSYLLVK